MKKLKEVGDSQLTPCPACGGKKSFKVRFNVAIYDDYKIKLEYIGTCNICGKTVYKTKTHRFDKD